MKRKKGFSLLELSIVIAIGAMIMAGMLKFLIAFANKQSAMINQNRAKEIQLAIEAFVVKNNRLPCPTNPSLPYTNVNYGAEALAADGTCDFTVTVNGASVDAGFTNQVLSAIDLANSNTMIGNTNHKIVFGALPFKALGLQEASMYDNFGNKFTYIVPAGYAANRSGSTNRLYQLIKGWTRVAIPVRFFNTSVACSTNVISTATVSANNKFCMERISSSCLTASAAKPLVITTLAGEGWMRNTSNVNLPGDIIITPCRFSVKNSQDQYVSAENLAYTLISHGQNGYGAWNKNGELNPDSTNINEKKNSFNHYNTTYADRILYPNGTATTREISIISDPTNKQQGFDDEVYYVTIDNLLANTEKNLDIYCHQSTSFLDQVVPNESSTASITANDTTASCYVWRMLNNTQKDIQNDSQSYLQCDKHSTSYTYSCGFLNLSTCTGYNYFEYKIKISCQNGGVWSNIGTRYK